MRRSAGVTISAVVAFVGSGFSLLVVGLVALSFVIGSVARPMPRGIGHFQASGAVFYLGFAAWRIASGAGLLKLREWARISLLVFAVLLAFGSIVAALVMLFIPMPVASNDPNTQLTAHVMPMIRIGSVLLYGGFGALGVWWLYYFNKRSVRDEFRSGPRIAAGIPWFAGPMRSSRPVTISVGRSC